jgi:hypothetical protein
MVMVLQITTIASASNMSYADHPKMADDWQFDF